MAATATNGILLYPSLLYSFPTTPYSNSVASSSSSGASSSSRHLNNNASASMPPTPQRKIRFAPLPDPRRSVIVTDDGSEFPIPDELTTISCPPMLAELDTIPSIPSLAMDTLLSELDTESDSTSRSSSRASKGADSSATTPTASASDSVSSFTQDSPSYQTKTALPPIPNPLLAAKLKQFEDNSSSHTSWASKPKSIFRPFLRRPHSSSGATPTLSSSSNSANLPSASSSTSTLHPHPKHAPFPRINLSSPSLGLFRVSSRHRHHDDDDYSDDGKSGGFMKLAKWTSSSSSVNKQHSHNHFHTPASPLNPLTRTQSRGSVQSVQNNGNQTPFGSTASLPLTRVDSGRINDYVRPASSMPGRRPSTASGVLSTPTSPTRKGKGTRMLNGRVYGHRRNTSNPNGNPFANARDEADPEFVEWGYGGMGSVRNGSGVGHGVWGRLQSERPALGGGGKTEEEEELDDGSGMGWVRKRREQKEKEKKEREDKERQAKEEQGKLEVITEGGDAKEEVKLEVVEKEKPFVRSEEIEQVKDRPDTAATITLSSLASPILSSTLSTPKIRNDVEPSKPSDDRNEHDTRVVNVSAHSPSLARRQSHGRSRSRESIPTLEKAQAEDTTQTIVSVDTKEDETDESEEDEEEGNHHREEDDEDTEDESENEEDAEKRKTALGAGVEKISRHK